MKMKRRFFSLLLVFVLALTFIVSALPGHAHADVNLTADDIKGASATWVNRAFVDVHFGSQTVRFFDRGIGDTDYDFQAQNYVCPSDTHLKFSNSDHFGTAQLWMKFIPPNQSTGGCQDYNGGKPITINVADPPVSGSTNSNIFFNQHDTQTINEVDGWSGFTFTQSSQFPDLFLDSSGNSSSDKCADIIQVDRTSNTYHIYQLFPSNGVDLTPDEVPPPALHATGCYVLGTINAGQNSPGIPLDHTKSYPLGIESTANQPPTNPVGGAGGAGSVQTPTLDCEIKLSSPLTWLACPIIGAANAAVNSFDALINQQLTINTDQLLNENGTAKGDVGKNYFAVWSTMRYLALSLLVVIGLVMVISQALSIGIFDTYSIRKIMPRLLLSVIFISLSWNILKLFVTLSNDLGNGIRYLIYLPFFQGGGSIDQKIGINAAGSGVAVGGLAIAAGIGFLGTLALAVTALIAVITAVVVLIFRQILVLLLVVFSPLAIVALILPNLQRVWKIWWDNFTKVLLMFPLITGMVAIGRVFAATANQTQGGSLIGQLMVFIGYYGPYFALPAMFRLSGGILSTASNFANQARSRASRPLSGFARRHAAANWKDRAERAQNENFFKGNGAVRSRLNRGIQTATLIPKAGLRPSRWNAKLGDARAGHTFDDASKMMQEDADFARIKDVDHMLDAARTQTTHEGIMKSIKDSGMYTDDNDLRQQTAAVEAVQRKHGIESVRAAATMQLAATGTGYTNSGDMLEAINLASGNDRGLANRMLGSMRGLATNSRRYDLGGAGMIPMMTQLNAMHADGNSVVSHDAATAELNRNAYDVQGAGAVVAGRVQSAEQMSSAMVDTLDRVFARGDDREISQALASTAGVIDAAGQASPENGRLLADKVMNRTVTINGTAVTVGQLVENRRSDPNFQQMRREYQTGAAAAATGVPPPTTPGAPAGPVGPTPGFTGYNSDRRIKRSIVYLHTNSHDIKIYSFQYVWSDQHYVGVMAQDLLVSHPEAVVMGTDGYYRVNYALLGMKMETLEEWESKHLALVKN